MELTYKQRQELAIRAQYIRWGNKPPKKIIWTRGLHDACNIINMVTLYNATPMKKLPNYSVPRRRLLDITYLLLLSENGFAIDTTKQLCPIMINTSIYGNLLNILKGTQDNAYRAIHMLIYPEASNIDVELLVPFKNIAIAIEYPTHIKYDENGSLHGGSDGYAIKFPDGSGWAYWHGRLIPNEWIDILGYSRYLHRTYS